MRIRQEHTFLNSLLSDLRSGRMLPAGFQRPYVWGTEDCLSFFESILRGYPVGAFLAWTPARGSATARVARPRLGPIVADDNTSDALLLLDGQNRLATLAWMARDWRATLPADLTEHERHVWGSGKQLVVDLQAHCLRFVPPEQADEGMTLPSCTLLDGRVANPLIRERWDGIWAPFGEPAIMKALKWFDEAQAAFKDARVIFTVMDQATPEEARDAFLHICRTGVPMSQEDFDQAIRWNLPG